MKPIHIACCILAHFARMIQSSASPEVIQTNIHVDQFGYPTSAKKIAVIADPQTGYNAADSYTPGAQFEVREWTSDLPVFMGPVEAWNNGETHLQSGDKVWWFDFSEVIDEGSYYLFDLTNQVGSGKFEISDCVYHDVLKTACRAFFYQRCGHQKTPQYAGMQWADGICHHGAQQDTDCRAYDNQTPSTSRDLSGGWHDAGDYNKYVNFTFEPVLDLLDAYAQRPELWTDDFNITESGNGIPDILDEVKYELDWLLKMQNEDGSLLSIVGAMNYNSASPPSDDVTTRVYGPATTAASFTGAAIFARAAKIFGDIGQTAYANQLETAAIAAWDWGSANPGIVFYNAGTIVSGEQQTDEYGTYMRQITGAIYLADLTSASMYQTYVDMHYAESDLIQWGYAYPFEYRLQKALLHYSFLATTPEFVANDIQSTFEASMSEFNGDNLPAFTLQTDAYRAYLSDNNYTWGSNTTKGRQGMMFLDMYRYNLDAENHSQYFDAAEAFIEYFHGINPNGLVYLTNMADFGAEQSCRSIYHAWFSDGSALWDQVGTSTHGPAPGFVPGGANPTYTLDWCCPIGCGDPNFNAMCDEAAVTPPLAQPIQKSYRDWNTGWPQNSWTITEIGIYTQAAYVNLLSSFTDIDCMDISVQETAEKNQSLQIFPNPAQDKLSITFTSEYAGIFQIDILDETGRMMTTGTYTTTSTHTSIKEDVSKLQHG
ncbi:MAG: glycoside hydrolase family 9 protein, partial [Flavobacteriales bacterium]|nr:glycoside hydrolase family 9 protein [Flavobacteriales bacterium]